LHGAHDRFVAADPGAIASPTAAFNVEARVFLSQFFNGGGEVIGAGALAHAGPDSVLEDRNDGGEILLFHADRREMLKIFRDVHWGRRGVGGGAHRLEEGGGEFVHHDATVFAVSDLGDELGDGDAVEFGARKCAGFGKGLHLGDELGVAALGLHDRDDLGGLA